MPPRPDQVPCESCGRMIIWTKSPKGADLPLDARPVTVYTIQDTALGKPNAVARTITDELAPRVTQPIKTYISHFVSCLQPSRFSAVKRRAAGL